MKWTKLSLWTTTEAIDYISSILDEMGIRGMEIEDHVPLTEQEKESMFTTLFPDMEEDDGKAVVSFYIGLEDDPDLIMNQVKEKLQEYALFADIGECKMEISQTEDVDWINNWKQFFKPFRIDDDIVIKPTWETLEETSDSDIVIEIDPGVAFGTGSHETTKLCILALKKYVNAESRVLDVGCGSGILSIIALKLGAAHITATDIDPNAIISMIDNVKVNHLKESVYALYQGDLIADASLQREVGFETYDIVTANILAEIIIPLSVEIRKHMKKDGIFIAAGIIDTRADEVEKALLMNGFRIKEKNRLGEWISFTAEGCSE